jgi:uncharacterized protein
MAVEVFADTAGWANIFVRTEPFHSLANKQMNQWHSQGIRVVTTNYVLLELIALMSSPLRLSRNDQIKVVETIKSSFWVEVIHIDRELDDESWQLLKDMQDKSWSLVDCSSFVVMKKRNISQAFTTDHHFEQAGYINVLK